MLLLDDSTQKLTALSDKAGMIHFQSIGWGYYRLRISFIGLQTFVIDSLWFREDRSEFNLHELVMHPRSASQLSTVVVYSEKPVIESKDGNITFNASESALSAGASASELLNSVPLVSRDADGKISVRGKEPRILIDDKPVELNLQQLQDLLESMPGSSIEKIEVMTNPPPQYANEQGGVINIVTRKGKAGRSGRINLSGGTRGEAGVSGSYSYRKNGFAIAINAGMGYNRFSGYGHSVRQNLYADSSNHYYTDNNNNNDAWRPNLRVNLDYDLSKFQSLNAVLQLNGGETSSFSETDYQTVSFQGLPYRISNRSIQAFGHSQNEALNISYVLRSHRPGEQLRIILNNNLGQGAGERHFYQRFFNSDYSFSGIDSSQQQRSVNDNSGHLLRADYDRPLANAKTFFSLGSFYSRSNSYIGVDAAALRKTDNQWYPLDLLSNNFRFHQTIINLRASVRQVIRPGFNLTLGSTAENTAIWFELLKEGRDARNNYWTWLPFANLSKNWNEKTTLTFSWRRSIRRPGINELNPTIDFADPYNIYFGNEKLRSATADNFDLVIGRSRPKFFINLGTGFNQVRDIFSRVRTLLTDGKTQVTWENISGRKEYELSSWGGLTIARKWRTNMSINYTFNQYSRFDRDVNHYRNGGSFTSNLNSSFTPTDKWSLTGSFTFNRFASPQGYARWNWSMNTGIQRKFFNKRLTATLNLIDPIRQQQNRSLTWAERFIAESFGVTRTRNYRLSLSYNLVRPAKKPVLPPLPLNNSVK